MENFAKLNDEIAGTENRISTARTDFNEAIMRYNKKVRRFPSNIFANIFGFDKKDGFKADEGNEKAPDMSEILK
jgi:LemA protein